MRAIILDFETHYSSQYSLSKMSTQEYVRDARFQAIGVAIQEVGVDPVPLWYTGHALEAQMDYLRFMQDDVYLVAHNCLFDATILSLRYNVHPAHLGCTLGMANALGMGMAVGGSLSVLTEHFRAAGYPIAPKGMEVHDALGKRLEDFTPAQLAAYGRYCVTDTTNCGVFYRVFRELLPVEELLWQSQVVKMHTIQRMRVDGKIVADELVRVQSKRQAALDDLRQRLGLSYIDDEVLRSLVASRPKLAELLTAFGVTVPMKKSPTTGKLTPALSKKDTEFLKLLQHPDDAVRAVVEARLEIASNIEASRCKQFLRLAELPAFSAPYKISGAHTHRLGGCLVADTMIVCLTSDGSICEKRIVDVLLSDLVWDGTEFVEHEGVKFSGYQEVIEHSGITGTACHPVFTGSDIPQRLDCAAASGTPIVEATAPRGWCFEAGRLRVQVCQL